MNEVSEKDKKKVLELFKKGQLKQALEACEEKSKNKAPNFFLLHIKGLIYAGLGRDQEAIEIYKLALDLNASSEHAHYNLCLLYTSPSPRD